MLYGEIAYAPWDVWITVGGRALGPRAVWVNGGALLLQPGVVGLVLQGAQALAFDPALAAALGFRVGVFHYLLMGAVSVTMVGAFESVGAILVVAMLVVPPATAYLLTDRLARMLGLVGRHRRVVSVLGYVLARALDASIAGAMSVVIGAMFALALAFSPARGLVPRAWRRRRLSREATALARTGPAA